MTLRRVIQRIVVFLLLGAIVNVAVAWGFALMSNPFRHEVDAVFTATNSELCVIRMSSGLGAFAVVCNRGPNHTSDRTYTSFYVPDEIAFGLQNDKIPRWAGLRNQRIPMNQSDVVTSYRKVIASGWPSLSLFSDVTFENVNRYDRSRYCVVLPLARTWAKGDFASYQWSLNPPALPLCPIRMGFAINTLFYAAILWTMFAVPLALRRRRRVKRRLCPACAYLIGTSSVCTECGKALATTGSSLKEACDA